MLEIQPDGTYLETAEDSGVGVGGWAWDTKTEDFDLNGTVDMYISNGSWIVPNISPSNMYFRNDGGGKFADVTTESGLQEFFILQSTTAVDVDGDGDLDLLGQAVNGPVLSMRNNSQSPNRIGFDLRDEAGNTFCIGCRVTISHDDGTKQTREIQAGGGFLSYDSPKVYFGAPEGVVIEGAEVFWSTGQTTVLDQAFDFGSMHKITRSSVEE